MSDRLLNTGQVGDRLGGIRPNDVRALMNSGKLHYVIMPIRPSQKRSRGRPRRYVRESELNRFIADLKEPSAYQVERATRPSRRPKDIESELAAAKHYHR
jgi:hypothetical protein